MNFSMQIDETIGHLKTHLEQLTIKIGERSVLLPENLHAAADYIAAFYQGIGLPVRRQTYQYKDVQVSNIISETNRSQNAEYCYLVGAHYDSVAGTVGADDNASAVAVQLEVARQLSKLYQSHPSKVAIKFVSFALEEPPVYGTRLMGSRVYAKQARKEKEKIDGMICLEMVGYACRTPNCQRYPFPLMYMDYPDKGDFIGIVSNFKSREFSRNLFNAFEKNPVLPVVKLTVPLNGWIMPSVRLSDHASFWDKGYKAVMITDSAFYRNPYYHLSSDTMDKLDFDYMAQLVKSLCLFFLAND